MSVPSAFSMTGSLPWRAWRNVRKPSRSRRPLTPAAAGSPAPAGPSKSANPLQSLESHFTRHPTTPAQNQAAAPLPVDPLQALAGRWKQLPAKLSLRELEDDPDLAQTQIQLIYDTELITQQVCGAPRVTTPCY